MTGRYPEPAVIPSYIPEKVEKEKGSIMARRQTLDQWCAEAFVDEDKDGPCTAISLVHMTGTSENEIHTVKLDGSRKMTAKQLGDLFRHKAESYAEELPGVQTFSLIAFYSNRNEPQARKPFTVGGATEFQGGLATEGPTGSGMAQQAMRHCEAMVQLAFRQTSMLFASSQETITALTAQNARLMSENRDALDIVKTLVLDRATGIHEHRMEALKYERSSEERRKLFGMAPALINNLTGRQLFPESSEDTALVEALCDSLDENALRRLLAADIVPKPLLGMLATRWERLMRERRLEREEGETRLENGVDPEQDTVGGVQ